MPLNKTSASTIPRLARWNLIFAYTSLFCYGLADNLRGPIYPEIRNHFDLSDSQGSWFFVLASLMATVAGALTAWPLRRWSYLRVFQASVGTLILSQFIFALSSHFMGFLIGAFFFGICAGLLGVLQNVLVLVAAKGPNLSKWMNGLHANYGFSSLLAPLLVSLISFFSSDFRASFWCVGLAGLVIGVASFKIEGFLEPEKLPVLKEKSKTPASLWVMAAIFALYVGSEVLIGSRIAHFTRDFHQADLRESGAWTSLFFMGLFAGRILFSVYHPSWPRRYQLMLGLAASVIFAVLGLFVSPWMFGLMGLTMGPCYPLAMSVMSEIFSHRLATAAQVCIAAGNMLLIFIHLLVGQICDVIGIQKALLLSPIGLFIAAILVMALPKLGAEVKHA